MKTTHNQKLTSLIILSLIITSGIAYGRISDNGFINYDDVAYIIGNNNIKSGINLESIKWAFTATNDCYWHPLTWLSHMLDWSLFQYAAGAHHLISLLLHIGTVIFLFLFLNKTTKVLWPSAFAAAFFALHPLRVESVAWAAERKDVLSMFFGMASVYTYALYNHTLKRSFYFLCIILFAFSLMSKPLLVTLPFILLLLDYWPLERLEKVLPSPAANRCTIIRILIWEKIPFFILAIASSMITRWTLTLNKDDLFTSLENLPYLLRILNAIVSYVSYLRKIFWPFNLAVFYPIEYPFPLWQILIGILILFLVTVVVFLTIKKYPFLFVGWSWYVGTMVPMIGLVTVSSPAMGDRYTYLPSIGIAIMLAWGIPILFQQKNTRKIILFPAAIIIFIILMLLTRQQCGYWKNSTTLFSHALRVTKENALSRSNLGLALFEEGRIQEAIDNYSRAISLKPDFPDFYIDRGYAFSELGQYQLAINDFSEAIRLNSDYAEIYYYYRGNTFAKMGQYKNAIQDYNECLRLKQYYADTFYNRKSEVTLSNKSRETAANIIKTSSPQPDWVPFFMNRGKAYASLGNDQKAIQDFNEVIHLAPNDPEAYLNRAIIYFKQGNHKPGCRDAQKACELGLCEELEEGKNKGYCD